MKVYLVERITSVGEENWYEVVSIFANPDVAEKVCLRREAMSSGQDSLGRDQYYNVRVMTVYGQSTVDLKDEQMKGVIYGKEDRHQQGGTHRGVGGL